MKKYRIRPLIGVVLTICCSVSTAFSAFAGPGSSQSENASPIVVCGESQEDRQPQADSEPIALESPGGQNLTALGTFTVTGYCGCETCSGGHSLTYSGVVPTADHTISADLSRFPIGTRLMIGDTIYTVEDKGSSVQGDTVDIFYDTHEEALKHGTTHQEVFLVN